MLSVQNRHPIVIPYTCGFSGEGLYRKCDDK